MTDWSNWVKRWDEQQERYLPHREERFSLMLDLIAELRGEEGLAVLDLCCGNGSISRRLLERFPDVTIVAVDLDPVHLEIARRTLRESVRLLETDLRRPGWSAAIEPGSFDAAVTATALHWLSPDELVALYAELAPLLAEGGLLLNADHLPVASHPVAEPAQRLLERWQAPRLAEGEDHSAFHEAARRDPTLAPFAEERARRFSTRAKDEEAVVDPDIAFHRQALAEAGFRESGEVWRYLSDALLIAIR